MKQQYLYQQYNPAQVKERLSLYSRMGIAEQYFSIQKLKKAYQQKEQKKQQKRTQEDIYYAQGMRAGLPHASHEHIQYHREREDELLKNRVLQEAKSIYRKGENLSRWFGRNTAKIPSKQKSYRKFKEANVLYLRGYHISKRFSQSVRQFPTKVKEVSPHFRQVAGQSKPPPIKTYAPPLITPEKKKPITRLFKEKSARVILSDPSRQKSKGISRDR